MGKSKKNRAAAMNQIQHKSQTSAEAFSFGDPVPVWGCGKGQPRLCPQRADAAAEKAQ